MKISYDPVKRARTLVKHGLDFDDAPRLFAGLTLTREDDREEYGETRYQTYGMLDGRLVIAVWTLRGDSRRIISMRLCNDRETKRFQSELHARGVEPPS